MDMQYINKGKALDFILFFLLLCIISTITYILFYHQVIEYQGKYPSDMYAYIDCLKGNRIAAYKLLFLITRVFSVLVGSYEIGLAATITFLNSVSIIIVKLVMNKYSLYKNRILNTFSACGLFFCSMIFSDTFKLHGIPYYYIGVGTPTPWHNATTLAVRPFMIISFLLGAWTLEHYENDFKEIKISNCKKYIFFSLFLLLSTMAKPTYTLVHLSLYFIIYLWRMVKCRLSNLKQSLYMGIFYIPTLIEMIRQYLIVFVSKKTVESRGIGLEFGKTAFLYIDNIPLAIFLSMAFPIVVLLFHIKDLKQNTLFSCAWGIYLMGSLQWYFLYEKDRIAHANFFWGQLCGIFLTFLISLLIVINDTNNIKYKNVNINVLVIEWTIFLLHLIMGIKYFIILFCGGGYY